MEQLITSDFKLGILGGGQLGKMLTLAASNWDINTFVLDPSSSCPAKKTCTQFTKGDFTNYDDVYDFGQQLDVLTIEIENVNIEALKQLQKEGKRVYPSPKQLELIKDKGLQKAFYEKNNFPTSRFILVNNEDEIQQAITEKKITFPFVQKTRKDGYDGKGVSIINNKSDLKNLLKGASILEEKVKIKKEIAVIVCRGISKEVKSYAPVEMEFNSNANLVEFLICPSSLELDLQNKAIQLAEKLIDALEIEGILAVEMFVDENNELLINEVAPRLHNSGHHTIEGAFTSQYEQHLRAILGFPLGSTELKIPSVMVNILGDANCEGVVKYEGLTACMAVDGIKLHIYGKKHTKPYRKMGHATVLDHDVEKAKKKAKYIKENLKVIT